MPSPTMPCVDRLHTASEHLIDTVDALADEEWSTASLLPAWSRPQVLAYRPAAVPGPRSDQ